MSFSDIQSNLQDKAEYLLSFDNPKIDKASLHLPGKKFIDQVFKLTDRSDEVRANLKRLRDSGRLKGTGYYSILPVDQSIEHSAGASFAPNPLYFDPENLVKLAIEGGCSGFASTYGVLSMLSSKYASKIPFIVKLNHNDLIRYPNDYDQRMFCDVYQAYELGAAGVGATIYFGSPESKRQIEEVSEVFAQAHDLGMFTILWCYLRNPAFQQGRHDYHTSSDLTAQANHLGATLGADIVKQKLPTTNGGYIALNKRLKYGKYDKRMYTELSSEHPIDLCRYQVLNGFAGRVGLINSGGVSGASDMHEATVAAVVNKRAGGSGLILGRKAFQKTFEQGLEILHAVQNVYLEEKIRIA